MPAIPIDFNLFLSKHPYHNEIRALIGEPLKGMVIKNKWSPCCIQVSYALNNAGAPIVENSYFGPEMGRKVRLFRGGEDLYIIDVFDMRAYLDGRYGEAENYKGTKQAMIDEIRGRTGIIRFGRAHVDVWEGERYHQQHRRDLPDSAAWAVSEAGAWGAPSVSQVGIFFWPVASRPRQSTEYPAAVREYSRP